MYSAPTLVSYVEKGKVNSSVSLKKKNNIITLSLMLIVIVNLTSKLSFTPFFVVVVQSFQIIFDNDIFTVAFRNI